MVQVPDNFGCINNTIKVVSGGYVDLTNPTPESIDLRTIANALSKECRFGNQTPENIFYSVAEHSLHAVHLAFNENESKECLRAILLHDAAEAYIGDLPKPLKMLLPEYLAIEQMFESAIGIHFGVDFDAFHDKIKHYDRLMLKSEKIQIWPDDKEVWQGFGDIPHVHVAFGFWGPTKARSLFIGVAASLGLFQE
jgi:uncharacterized protein